MLSRKMSIEEKIVRFLYDRRFLRAVALQNLLHDSRFASCNQQSVRNVLSKLSKKSVIRTGADGIMLHSHGKAYVERKLDRLQCFNSPFPKSAAKNLLVLFDIPENRKAEREWFRRQLQEFGYDMVQRSVWLGPSPLPKEFVAYVKAIGLKDCIKTFKLARTQTMQLKS